MKRRALKIVRGGLPELHRLDDEQLRAAWADLQSRRATLEAEVRQRQQALRTAAAAYDETVAQLNELSHTLRHFQRELGQRRLAIDSPDELRASQ